ncbi:CBS domain-containing protein [Roseofilum casamattae]|uniref:CBS domain-containing protein n=1 Tax=Roseofilum casamattae BLCC-M143 TaxID=3022442 RepID=A0ABT7C360_9CYAN|nr:CBS domain-containing protein [Roseofilum casamattae BLCC-M143]
MPKTVADVMTRNPVVVSPDASLKETIAILADRRISGLPVVNEEGKLVGVISETDLMWQETGVEPPPYIMLLDSVIYLENPATYEKELHKAMGLTVGEVMSDRPISVKGDRSLRDAAKLMQKHNIRRLPVLDDSEALVGILTRGDIIRDLASS